MTVSNRHSVRLVVIDHGNENQTVADYPLTAGLLSKDQALKLASAIRRVFTLRDEIITRMLMGKEK